MIPDAVCSAILTPARAIAKITFFAIIASCFIQKRYRDTKLKLIDQFLFSLGAAEWHGGKGLFQSTGIN